MTDCLYASGPVKLSIELFSGLSLSLSPLPLSLSPGVSLSTLFHKTLKGRTMVSYHDNVLQKAFKSTFTYVAVLGFELFSTLKPAAKMLRTN